MSAKAQVGFDSRTSKRMASKSTATSDYWQNADGTVTRKLWQRPVNYRDASGDWQPIDTSLQVGSDHRVHERANSVSVDFAPSAADPALAQVTLGSGLALSYGLQGAAAVTPSVSGAVAAYAGVLPGTDLRLSATSLGLKEAVILHDATASNSWTFPLDVKGLTPTPMSDGSVALMDGSGKTAGVIPAAYAFDSKVDPRSGDPATTHAVTYKLMGSGGKTALVVTLDPAWLHAKERVFPVTVDPGVDMYGTTTYAESGVAAGDHSMETTIKVGSYDSGTHSANSFLQFPNYGVDGSKMTVSAASLFVYDTWAATCTAERFDVAPVSSAWTASSVTSYPGPSFGSSIGNATPTVSNACANTGADRTKGDWVTVNLSTTTFNNWASGSSSDYGLAMYASTSDALHWKQFDSANSGQWAPNLELTYTGARLPQITSQAPPSGTVSPTLTPQLLANARIDSGLGNPRYDFQVYDANGTKVVDSGLLSPGSTAANWTVPAGKLKWGQTYEWLVQAYDGTNYSPASNWETLTTQVPQPVITSSLSQNDHGHGFDPAIGNYTTSATDATVPTVGPSLSVVRDYNSRDPRTSGAFGAAWSSVLDAKAAEQYDTSGAVQSVAVTYPDGSTVGYGKNSDGSFSPPSGRFATFKSVTGGYSLTDKNDTTYTFTQSVGSGVYGLTSVSDANSRVENFAWSSGQISTATSATSGRALHFTWSTPSGATNAHVATVVTDPVTAGNPSTALTWTYSYSGEQLTKVCSPVDTTGCTQYGYTSGSLYHNQVLDQGAQSFWPLAESSGSTAKSAVLSNEGTDNATYSGATLGQPGPLAGGSATAAGFNGTSSYVQLPNLHLSTTTAAAISLWFKTSAGPGVLYSHSNQQIAATTDSRLGDYLPALYVGSDGKLVGSLNDTGFTTITSSGSVTDGKWHHVVLSTTPTQQTMWLDGTQVGTATGWASGGSYAPALNATDGYYNYLGAGYLGRTWPDQPHYSTTSTTLYGTYFNGSIANAAFFSKALTQQNVTGLYNAGTHAASLLSSLTKPSGNTAAAVTYDPVTATVTHVTDDQGGSWTIAAPAVTGSSQVYRSAVLGSAPAHYFRFGEGAGATQAVDEINSGPATYNSVTLGSSGPFSDATAAAFNGTSSYVLLPGSDQVQTSAGTVEMWFKMPAGNTAGGVLYDEESSPVGPATSGYVPALYVGTTGKLYGKFWDTNGPSVQMVSQNPVNDGLWHHVALAVSSNSQTMYLDGVSQGSLSAALSTTPVSYVYVGAGMAGGAWQYHPTNTAGYFPGSIAEVAFYHSQLSGQAVANHFAAGKNSAGLVPMQTVTVTDPGSKALTYQSDPLNQGRTIAEIDGLGNKTTIGYDTGGFVNTVTDPNGNVTITGHDVRGNEVSKTTCQNQAAQTCSTTYSSYLPDDTSSQLSPSPTNDLLATSRDGRSASATDNTYLTSYTYDSAGDRTGVTTPPVPGFPNGRTTTTSYTDGTTIAAADSGYAPAGLPYKVVSPGGATTTVTYFHNGDVATVTDPDGQKTSFTYDNLGRKLSQTATSDTYPSGLITSYAYNGIGQVTQQTDPAVTNHVTGAIHTPQTSRTYNADGLVSAQTVADTTGGDASRATSYTYTPYDQVSTSTDALNNVTTFTYDGYGNKLTEKDPQGTVTAYSYDPNAHLLTQTLKGYTGDPNNPQPAKDLVQLSKAYDPAGRLASETDSMGNTTSYTYTDNNLQATVTRTDPTGHTSFVQQSTSYDAAGNPIQKVTNNGATTTKLTVDAANRTTATTVDPSGVNRTTTVSYTPDDHPATTTVNDGGNTTHTTTATYDPMGHLTSRSVQEDGSGHPVGWWPLNQTSGTTVTDASGTGNTATATGGVTWANNAATFDGTGLIATNGPVLNTAASYSVSAWVNLTTSAYDQAFVAQGGTNKASFYLKYSSSLHGWEFVSPNADATSVTWDDAYTTSATLNTWTHLVGVFNASTGAMSLYVNGSLAATSTDTTPWTGSGPLAIGGMKLSGGATSFPLRGGSISNAQAYPRALSAADVTTLFNGGRTSGTTASTSSATTHWALDQRGLPTSMTDPAGNVTNYIYDETGKLAVTSGAAVNVETGGGTPTVQHPVTMVGYDTFGSVTQTQDANGNTTTIAYDADGQKVKQTLPSYTPPGSSTAITAAPTWTYDQIGNVTDTADGLGKTTHYVYDQLRNVASITDPNSGVTKNTYDTNGDQLSTTTPSGAQTQATYDYLGRTLTSTVLDRYPTATSSTTTSSYTASATNPGGAFLASTTTQNGAITGYGYDNLGETTQITDAAGATSHVTYDLLGRKTSTTKADGTATTITYDQLNDPVLTQQTDTDGTTVLAKTSATYDADGHQLSATDARGDTSTFTRDALGQITQEVQPVDATTSITTSFGYDAAGNRTRYTDGRSNSWIYGYNSWNKPESALEPATATYTATADRTSTIAYDADGRPVTQNAPGGVSVSLTYDNLGNLTGKSGSGADAATATRSFTYDGDGRMLTAATTSTSSAPATSETFTYNDRGLLLTTSGSAGSSSFSYNGDGLLTARTDAAGATNYTYDSADRLSTLTDPATGTQLTYGYDQLSQLTSLQYGTGANTRSYGYDHLHRPTSDTLKTSGGTTIASIAYGYDAGGNETSKTTTGFTGPAANTYTYDYASRLTSWNNGTTSTTYGYDASGNRIQVGANVYTYDARDQLTSDGVNSYTYTARGTLASQTTGANTATYTSDAYGQQVTEATLTGGTQTYVTDALGRDVSASGPAGNTTFSYSGTANTLASDGATTYTRAPDDSLIGIGTPNGSGGSTGTGVLAYTDQHNDVVGNFAATGGTLTGSTSYDPLGNITSTSAAAGKLGYQSGWTDATTGKVNMLSRWYNPAVGQFQNKDTVSLNPLPDSTQANPFAYIGDNPMLGTDPTGHCWDGLGWLCSAASSAASWSYNNLIEPAASWGYHNIIQPAWDDLGEPAYNYGSSLFSSAGDFFSSVGNTVEDWGRRAIHAGRHLAHVGINYINDGTRYLRHAAGHLAHGAGRIISSVGHGALRALKDANPIPAVVNRYKAVWSAYKKHGIKGVWDWNLHNNWGIFPGVKQAWGAVRGLTSETVQAYAAAARGDFAGAYEHASYNATNIALAVLTGKAGEGVGNLRAGPEGAIPPENPAAGGEGGDTAGTEGDNGPSCTTHSFTAETPVLMANGTAKPISQIKIGDKITNAVPGTHGKTETHTVQNVIVTKTDHDFVALTIATQDPHGHPTGVGTITTTYHHPFYDITQAAFIDAYHLKPGDQLQQPNGHTATILQTHPYHATQTTYDLTINGLHTYYVEAGDAPVLVHNTDGCLDGATNHDVLHPETGNIITDIDHIEGGVLWEEKSALYGDEDWLAKHIDQKFEKYMTARQYLPGYENAPIGFRFTNPRIDPRFQAAVEARVEQLRAANPGVDIRLEFASQ